MSASAEHVTPPVPDAHLSISELARRQGVRPIESLDELACDGIFDSDEELSEFLEHVRATRDADLA